MNKESIIGNRESVIDIRPKNYESGIENMAITNELKKSQSFNNPTNKLIKRILTKESHDNIDSNMRIKRKITLSCNKITNNLRLALNKNNNKKSDLNSSSFSSSNDNKKSRRKKRSKSNKKLIDAYNRNYKFYKNKNGKEIPKNNIIKEEPGKEDTLHPMRPAISFKNVQRYSVSVSKHFINNKINDMNKNLNSINKIANKKQSHGNLINNLINFKKMQQRMSQNSINFKNLKFDDTSTVKLFNDNKDNLIENSEENSISYDEIINDEIYSGEEIKVNKEENLLFKKVDLSNNLKKISHINELSNIKDNKNSKLEILLSSALKKDSSRQKNNIPNKENIFESNIKNVPNNLEGSSNGDMEMKRKWNQNSLIINNFSIEYESSYENCNIICGEKLIKNKANQDKLREFLINNILNSNLSNNNSIIGLTHNKTTNSNYQRKIKYREKRGSAVFSNTLKFLSKHDKNYFTRSPSLLSNSRTLNTNNNTNDNTSNNNIKRTSSLCEINAQKNKKLKNNVQSDLNDYNNNSHLSGKKMNKGPRKKLVSTKAAIFTGGFNGLNASPLETKKKGSINKVSSLMLSPFSKPKKRKIIYYLKSISIFKKLIKI